MTAGMGFGTMERIAFESACGSFPVVGDRRDRGAHEPFAGRIMWSVNSRFGGAGNNRRISVSVIPDGARATAFVPSVVDIDREFLGRLGKYDRTAHMELVDMLDWAVSKGFNVRVADVPVVHATFGSFSFEGTRRDSGATKSVGGRISWTARPENAPTATRRLRVSMAANFDEACLCDDNVSLDDNMPCGEIDAKCGFVGRLAEGDGSALDHLIGKMGWNADGGEFDVRPC